MRNHTSYLQPSVHHGDFKATRADSLASDVRPILKKRTSKIRNPDSLHVHHSPQVYSGTYIDEMLSDLQHV